MEQNIESGFLTYEVFRIETLDLVKISLIPGIKATVSQ